MMGKVLFSLFSFHYPADQNGQTKRPNQRI